MIHLIFLQVLEEADTKLQEQVLVGLCLPRRSVLGARLLGGRGGGEGRRGTVKEMIKKMKEGQKRVRVRVRIMMRMSVRERGWGRGRGEGIGRGR